MAQRVLVQVVRRSHHDIQLEQHQMMGKTGTAQVADPNARGYQPGAYMSSFLGAAPAAHPQVAAVVMIRRPLKSLGHYGGKVAGPAVKEIIRHTLAYLDVPPDGTAGEQLATRGTGGQN